MMFKNSAYPTPHSLLRDTFSKIIESSSKTKQIKTLNAAWIDTPIGPMISIADESCLYLLEFLERRGLDREIKKLCNYTKSAIIFERTVPNISIETELLDYFESENKTFSTPFEMIGTPFQKTVWKELCKIPYGETKTYLDIAKAIGNPKASRAVARANSFNQLAIIIPCHRVINTNGKVGGYAGGIERKQWMLKHER